MARGKRHGLYRREGGIWAFRYKERERWREKYTGKTDFHEAQKFKDDFERNLNDGTLPTEKSNWTVAQAAADWVNKHAAHLGSQKVKSNEQSLMRQLVRRLGATRLKNVTIDLLKTYQVERHAEVGERAVNLELRILVNCLKEANLWSPIAAHFKPLKEQPSDLGQALTLTELKRLEITASSNSAWEVAYHCEVLAANTGMRSGEIKKLELRDIDLEARRIRIRRAKTEAGWRLVELNQAALSAVLKLYQRAEMLGAKAPEHYILPRDLSRHTKETDPLRGSRGFDVSRHQKSWRSAWRSLRSAAGLGSLRFHDLRHSFITLMAERNVPLPVVQSMVGHMSARMTKHYTHISTQAQRKAVELLDSEPFVGKLVGKDEMPKEDNANLLN